VRIPGTIIYKEVIKIYISSGGQKAGGAEEEGEGEEEGGGEEHQEEEEGKCPSHTFCFPFLQKGITWKNF
jgi:hypothetical protein